MKTSTNQAPVKLVRYVELDSIRGLAAMLVVLHHFRGLWQTDTRPASATVMFFLRCVYPFGSEAVILFFVLSGFVLSLPAVNGRPQKYSTFAIRRVFRIYVPYLAALAVSVAGASWLHGIVTTSNWFHQFWSEPIDWRLVGQHILFLGVYDTNQFNPPIWSLVHEMRISLIFPFLCAFVLSFKSKWSLVIALGLTVLSIVMGKPPFHIESVVADSVQYAGIFVLGIFLARERDVFGAWFRQLSRFERILVGCASLAIFLFAGAPLIGPSFRTHYSLLCISHWITAFGAGALMIIGINSALCKRFLSWGPIHFLGEISYSLYLWHSVVLLFCVHLLYGRIPLLAILCLFLVLSIPVSWLSYRWIEVPSMNLGRRLSNAYRKPSGEGRVA